MGGGGIAPEMAVPHRYNVLYYLCLIYNVTTRRICYGCHPEREDYHESIPLSQRIYMWSCMHKSFARSRIVQLDCQSIVHRGSCFVLDGYYLQDPHCFYSRFRVYPLPAEVVWWCFAGVQYFGLIPKFLFQTKGDGSATALALRMRGYSGPRFVSSLAVPPGF